MWAPKMQHVLEGAEEEQNVPGGKHSIEGVEMRGGTRGRKAVVVFQRIIGCMHR